MVVVVVMTVIIRCKSDGTDRWYYDGGMMVVRIMA